jgi:hypothetical protein
LMTLKLMISRLPQSQPRLNLTAMMMGSLEVDVVCGIKKRRSEANDFYLLKQVTLNNSTIGNRCLENHNRLQLTLCSKHSAEA